MHMVSYVVTMVTLLLYGYICPVVHMVNVSIHVCTQKTYNLQVRRSIDTCNCIFDASKITFGI